MFKKGMKVVKVIDVRGHKTATIQVVESVRKDVVSLVDSGLAYNKSTGAEIDPPIPGCRSEIIKIEE